MLPNNGNSMVDGIKVTRKWRKCETCNGKGIVCGETCPDCEGKGGHYEEVWR